MVTMLLLRGTRTQRCCDRSLTQPVPGKSCPIIRHFFPASKGIEILTVLWNRGTAPRLWSEAPLQCAYSPLQGSQAAIIGKYWESAYQPEACNRVDTRLPGKPVLPNDSSHEAALWACAEIWSGYNGVIPSAQLWHCEALDNPAPVTDGYASGDTRHSNWSGCTADAVYAGL